jgi:hypothetical protein
MIKKTMKAMILFAALLAAACLAYADEMSDIIAGTPVSGIPPEAKAMMAGYSMWGMIWATLFGGVGVFAFLYGKKKSNAAYIIIGILLCLYPFLVKEAAQVAVVGAVLSAGLYFFRPK